MLVESDLEGERTTNADLMKRLTDFAQRLQTRNDSLTKVKKQSDGHIHSLSEELSQVKKVSLYTFTPVLRNPGQHVP